MKKKTVIKSFVIALSCCFATTLFGQQKSDSAQLVNNPFVILRIENTLLVNNLYVLYNDSQMLDLKEQLNLRRNSNDLIRFEDKLTFAGIKYLEQQGYEIITSNAYGDIGTHVKEYIFRKRK